jgi:hypothetical protein
MTQSAQPTEKNVRNKRGAGLTTELRSHLESITKLAVAFPFAKSDADKLLQQVHKMIDRVRLAEDQATREDEFIRMFIITKCGGGRIEKWIRELPEVDDDGAPHLDNKRAKEKFRAKGWRT